MAALAKAGDLAARNELVMRAAYVAPMMARRFPYRFRDDLVGVGNLALVLAVPRFDPSRCNRYASYAKWPVWRAMWRYLRCDRLIRLPVVLAERNRRQAARIYKDPASALGVRHHFVSLSSCRKTLESFRGEPDEMEWMLSTLDPRMRQIVLMHVGHGSDPLPFREISKRTGLSLKIVWNEWKRALEELHNHVQGE